MSIFIFIRGGGDLASGVALRLHRAGLQVAIAEIAQPLAVRRTVAFASTVYEGEYTVEELKSRLVSADQLHVALEAGEIPVLIDPDAKFLGNALLANPQSSIVVDARLTKQPPEQLSVRPLLHIGLGPGFTAPADVDAVIETQRGHTLGRVIWDGSASSDTAKPEGDTRRVLRAPIDGTFDSAANIGEHFEAGQRLASVDDQVITAPFAGILRGLLHPGLKVTKGMKIGDIDPRDDPSLCNLVSDKALAVGGGVLEALLFKPEIRSKLW